MAGSVNKVLLVGRLGQDPKLSYLPSGQPVANFNVATDDSFKDKEGNKVERTEWHRVAVYGRSAEFCANYLSKGRLVYIEGTLRTRKWQDKDGHDRYTTEVIVDMRGTIQGLDRAQPGEGRSEEGIASPPRRQPQGQGRSPSRQAPPAEDDDIGPIFPSEVSGMDDVPF